MIELGRGSANANRIASRMGVRLSALLTANNLTTSSVIHPGNTLVVPAGGTVPAAPAGATAVIFGHHAQHAFVHFIEAGGVDFQEFEGGGGGGFPSPPVS